MTPLPCGINSLSRLKLRLTPSPPRICCHLERLAFPAFDRCLPQTLLRKRCLLTLSTFRARGSNRLRKNPHTSDRSRKKTRTYRAVIHSHRAIATLVLVPLSCEGTAICPLHLTVALPFASLKLSLEQSKILLVLLSEAAVLHFPPSAHATIFEFALVLVSVLELYLALAVELGPLEKAA